MASIETQSTINGSRFAYLAARDYQCDFQRSGEKRQAALTPVGLVKKDYWSAFHDYENVEVVAGFGECFADDRSHLGAPHEHGLEVEKDIGYIRITEVQPIIAAVVLGSGCTMPAYVCCEYPQPGVPVGEVDAHGPSPSRLGHRFNMQTLRRQRIEGLMSQHPCGAVRTYGEDELTYKMDYEPRVRECTTRFEIEPTTTITFRGGSGVSSHFSFRMIRLYFEA